MASRKHVVLRNGGSLVTSKSASEQLPQFVVDVA